MNMVTLNSATSPVYIMSFLKRNPQKLIEEGVDSFQKREFRKALNKFDQALLQVTNDPNLWSLKAQAEFNLGDFNGAAESIDKAIELDQSNALNWQLKGTFLLKAGENMKAKNMLLKAVELHRSDVSLVLLGQAAYKLGELDEALEYFEETLEMDPDHPLGTQMKGLVLFKKMKFKEAIPNLEKALNYGHSEYLEKILEECKRRSQP